ncbi:MAG: hypothetical protein N2258_08390 [Brevinematales bacterium]|nr:hypothetical protein [Brevinematales bacterium]
MIKRFFFVFLIFCIYVYSEEKLNLEKYKKKYDPLYIDIISTPESINSIESIKLDLAEYVYPVRKLLLTNPLEKYKSQTKPILISEEELFSFSDENYLKVTRKKQEFKIDSSSTNKKTLEIGFEEWETKIILAGGVSFRAGYGFIWKDPAYTSSFPGINFGLNLDQKMRVNVVGKIGERIKVGIDHNSESSENTYEIGYKALETDKGILREITAGNVELNIPQSSYFIKYEGTSKENYGLKSVLKWGDFENQTVISLIKTKKGYKKFVGSRQLQNTEIMDINYLKRKYIILPDNQIDNGSIELYISTSEATKAEKIIDGKYFYKLINGKDFSINLNSGEIYLNNSIDRNIDLVINYTHHGGSPFSYNIDDHTGTDGEGKLYLYLWRNDFQFSRFFHNGYYQLSQRNFDPSYGFVITVVYTYNKTQKAEFQFNQGDFFLYPDTGIIKFKNPTPFPDPSGKIYTNASPTPSDSTYTMQISFYRTVSTYQLDFNVVEGSEKIYINGRLLPKSEYRIISSIGEIYFNNPNLINDSDIIEVYYEYKPFWSGSQKLSFANRFDYKPNKIINLGSTMVYNILQREEGAPQIGNNPDALFMGDIDGSLNFARLFNFPEPLNIITKGEYAISYYDPNTLDYAIVEDFETSGENYVINKNEIDWILVSPTTNINGLNYLNRGKLLYKDYRIDNWDGSVTPLNYTVEISQDKIMSYSFKPGPYNALGGHLSSVEYPNISQTALVFDYDFRDGGDWIGAVHPVGDGPSGINLSDYDEISIWIKLQGDIDGNNIYEDNGTEEVEFYLALGDFNEDSDGDKIFDYEVNSTDPGYEFNNPLNNSVETRIGRGRKGGGDGKIQTEDLNRDGIFNTNENLIVIPSKNVNTDITNITLSQNGWKKFTIRIQSLSADQIKLLSKVTGIGIYIKKKNGTKGRVILDSIDFKKVNWTEKRIDGVRFDNNDILRVNLLTSMKDPEYSARRFYVHNPKNDNEKERLEIFEKLHGYKTDTEAYQYEEKAISIKYNLSNSSLNTNTSIWEGGKKGLVYKRSSKPYNLSLYRQMAFYLFLRKTDETGSLYKNINDSYEGENFILLIGNSDNSFYEWKIPLKNIGEEEWKKVSLNLEDLTIELNNNSYKPKQYGVPNLRNVNYLALGIENENISEATNRGEIWVNELYTYSDKSSFGTAYYTETIIEYKNPLFKFNNFEILGPFNLTGSYENKGLNFYSSETNKTESQYSKTLLSYNSSLVKLLNYKITYSEENSQSETNKKILPENLQWDSERKTYNHTLNLVETSYFPLITHSFTEVFENKRNRNIISIDSNDYILVNQETKYDTSSKISCSKTIPIFELIKLNPFISWEENYKIYDFSNLTNDNFISNSSIYGTESFGKTLDTSLGINISPFNIIPSYLKSMERYNRIFNIYGYRDKINKLKEESLSERYSEILSRSFTGFVFDENLLYKLDKESYKIKFSGNPEFLKLKTDFYIEDSLLREASAFSYDNNNTLTSRYEKYNILNDNKLTLYPKVIIDKISFSLKRNIDFGYQSPAEILAFTNVFSIYSQVYYFQPFHYNPYINGDNARLNSLILSTNYNKTNFQSSVKFYDNYALEFYLTSFNNIFDIIIPTSYYLRSYLQTERNYQSYVQWKEGEIATTYNWKILDYIKLSEEKKGFKPGDIKLELKFKNKLNYNTRKNTDDYYAYLNETIWFNDFQNLIYGISLTFTKESINTNISEFDPIYNLNIVDQSYSPIEKWTLGCSLIYNWELKNIKEINILLATLPLSEQTVANKEGLTITTELINYEGFKFSRFQQKIIEITIDHETQYRFSDYISANLFGRFVFNQYADVAPLENSVRRTYFNPGYGLQIGLDVRITF